MTKQLEDPIDFCNAPCPVVGCTNTLDPRWWVRTKDGRNVASCDGCGGGSGVTLDPEKPVFESPWLAAQARRKAP